MVSNKLKAGLAIVLVVVLVLVAFLFFFQPEEEIRPAAAFTISDSDGDEIALTDYNTEKVVLIEFMSTECDECPDIEDELKQIHEKESFEDDLVILSMSIDEGTVDLSAYKSERGIPWPVLNAPVEMSRDYNVHYPPKVVIIDREGYFTYEMSGERLKNDIEDGELEKALEETIDGIAPRISLSKLKPAPEFTVTDTDENIINLSDYRGKNVVLLDFMATWCVSCPRVEDELVEIYEDGKFNDDLVIISISISDTMEELQQQKEDNDVPWQMALASDDMVQEYSATTIPKVVIIDKDGYVTYEKVGGDLIDDVEDGDFEIKIQETIEGGASRITIKEVSLFGLAIIGGVATFFSPCSFPMLPGFMSYYLRQQVSAEKKVSTKKALASGGIAAFGIIIVFITIGILAILLRSTITSNISYLNIVVGILLVVLGSLMFTTFQYYKIIEPFQALFAKMKSVGGAETKKEKTKEDGNYFLGLFSYGVGYGAAAAGCTLPVFLSILVKSFDVDLSMGIIAIVLYCGTMAIFMIGITVAITVFGQGAVSKLSNYTEIIKVLTAGVLVSVGVYMVWTFFYDGNGPEYLVDFTRSYQLFQIVLHLVVWAVTIWKTHKAYRIAFPKAI